MVALVDAMDKVQSLEAIGMLLNGTPYLVI
jgi:hypothetical protein